MWQSNMLHASVGWAHIHQQMVARGVFLYDLFVVLRGGEEALRTTLGCQDKGRDLGVEATCMKCD